MKMDTKKLTICETWDALEPVRMLHTRLYHLEPIGVGTAQVESLTSYLGRLAFAHRVTVSKLVSREIAPAFRHPRTTKNSFFGLGNHGLLRANNLSVEMVKTLRRLTGRLDLWYLTLSPWAEIMAAPKIIRPRRAWCSGCLEEQRANGKIITEPLWWSFQQIEICPHHTQPLQTQCAHCHKQQFWLAPRSNVGYCSFCYTWLGVVPEASVLALPAMTDFEQQWQSWLVEAIGELLAAGPALRHVFLSERLVAGLSSYCAQVAGGNGKKFSDILTAHNLDISASRLNLWLSGINGPAFQTLLQLCFCLHTTPLAFLTNPMPTDPISLRPLLLPSITDPQPAKPTLTRHQLEKSLNAIIAANENPPSSLQQVAKRLNVSSSIPRKHFPEQCILIVERYRAYQKAKKEKRLHLLRENVRQATFDVYAQGMYPTPARVAKQLGKPVSMRDSDIRAFRKEAIRELGLQT